jgi:sulfur dioxygenase
MDIAVPANQRQGLAQDEIALLGWAVTADRAQAMVGCNDTILVDLREKIERQKHGAIPGALHAPYDDLDAMIQPGGTLFKLASATGHRLLFYCAFGERSAMAVRAAHEAGLESACHIHGGLDAWKKAGGPLTH